jgi:hypothetical protein
MKLLINFLISFNKLLVVLFLDTNFYRIILAPSLSRKVIRLVKLLLNIEILSLNIFIYKFSFYYYLIYSYIFSVRSLSRGEI